MVCLFLLCPIVLLFCALLSVSAIQLREDERLEEYAARNYSWPPKYHPDTLGWKKLMENRFAQISEMEANYYAAWVETVKSAFILPNFTEYGFGLARAPEALTKEIQEAIRYALATGNTRLEGESVALEGPQALFIDREDLEKRVMKELQPYARAWSGIEVTPNNAYGFRLYQNENALYMHTDKVNTHIISAIYHLDRSDDAEPWPIFIEGFDGKTYEVILEPGDILFYESAKCFHGRPKKFSGSWYTSVFAHFYPTDWQTVDHSLESHYAVPPHWHERVPLSDRKNSKLFMYGVAMKEPDCPNGWCRTQNAVKWNGPGEEGVWIAPNLQKHPLILEPTEDEEL